MSQIVSIPDVLFFQEGPGVRKSQFTNKGVKLLNVGNINNNKINLSTTEKYISEEEAYGKYSHFLVDDGDLLISCSGIVVNNFHNKISFITENDLPLCLNTSTMRFKSLDENKLYINFFYYFLMTTSFKKQIGQLITGSAQLNFGPSHIQKIKMPLPTLQNQKQVAKTLDKANELIELRKESITKLDELSKSIFIDMFGDPISNPLKWKIVKLEDLTTKITDGTHKTPIYKDSGIIFISAKNIKKERITFSDVKYISEEEHIQLSKRCNPEYQDILLTKSGSTGMSSIIPKVDFEFSLFESLCLIKYDRTKMNPFFLNNLLNSEATKFQYSKFIKGVAIKHLHLKDIRTLNIIYPPMKEQQKFAKIIEKIEEQKILYTQELEKLQENFDALLQRSFQE
ncbi:restriction endonuclease subunit S [Poseidonibacter lekithochrous]|uniref:restriction endonuclease subunit S n=1 Tax=Poseidonibacter TaxID=2321187 RepID=UPI001C09F481|nr:MULTISPECIES: restriction endonuclease subunit S [Poseidonibacter]MBU3014032.1 restriction endonuclease subunit S [Poseidonibacter lekithochrous]MDO6827328.1 restriction endonuclease subunit S [Poseidonibacter sp. 1_MG-2023]